MHDEDKSAEETAESKSAISSAADAKSTAALEQRVQAAAANQALELNVKLAAYTRGLFWATMALAIATAALALYAFLQLRAMRESLVVSRTMFAAEHRPWVAMKVEIASPLTYSAEDGWHIVIAYSLNNVGRGPAAHTAFHATIIPDVLKSWPVESLQGRTLDQMPGLGTDTPTELRKLCDAAKGSHAAKVGFGATLFPGQVRSGRLNIHAKSQLFEKAKHLAPYSGHFHLIACASYAFTAGDSHHVTAKAFTIFKRQGEDGSFDRINLEGENVELRDLAFAPLPTIDSDYTT